MSMLHHPWNEESQVPIPFCLQDSCDIFLKAYSFYSYIIHFNLKSLLCIVKNIFNPRLGKYLNIISNIDINYEKL